MNLQVEPVNPYVSMSKEVDPPWIRARRARVTRVFCKLGCRVWGFGFRVYGLGLALTQRIWKVDSW